MSDTCGLAKGTADFLGGSSHVKTQNPNWYDPLGPVSMDRRGRPTFAPTGGVDQRNAIFSQFDYLRPVLNANADTTANALRTAASNPGYAAARDLATKEINGDFLHGSPELDSAMNTMRAGADASAQNTAARIKSNFARNGVGFGTANQQALQSNQAAQTAQANATEAATRLQNYENERGIQQTAPAMLDQATQSPINYLAAIPNQYLAPLSQMAQVVSGLSGGGQIAQPDSMVRDGPLGELMGNIGKL